MHKRLRCMHAPMTAGAWQADGWRRNMPTPWRWSCMACCTIGACNVEHSQEGHEGDEGREQAAYRRNKARRLLHHPTCAHATTKSLVLQPATWVACPTATRAAAAAPGARTITDVRHGYRRVPPDPLPTLLLLGGPCTQVGLPAPCERYQGGQRAQQGSPALSEVLQRTRQREQSATLQPRGKTVHPVKCWAAASRTTAAS